MAASTPKITPANPRPTRPVSYPGAAPLDDPDTAKSALTNSEHHYQLLKGVAALEIADMAQARSVVLPPIRAGPAVSKPPICLFHSGGREGCIYRHHEAAQRNPRRSAGVPQGRETQRHHRTGLERWAAALPTFATLRRTRCDRAQRVSETRLTPKENPAAQFLAGSASAPGSAGVSGMPHR